VGEENYTKGETEVRRTTVRYCTNCTNTLL
jgi:hypothetical protein